MASADLRSNAVGHYEDLVTRELPPEYAISAASLPGQPLEVILDRARDNLVQGTICTSTVGAVVGAGYAVRLTDEATAHVDIVLPSEPSEEHWQTLRAIFGPPQDNPVKRPRPKGGSK
jgi:hypothetical protein